MLFKGYAENVSPPLFSTDTEVTITGLPHKKGYGPLLRALQVTNFTCTKCLELLNPSYPLLGFDWRLAVTFYQEEKDFAIDTVDITESPK